MLLFWMDRADSLSGVAKHLERRVSDYIKTNIHVTCSGMLQERLLRHTLDFTGADRRAHQDRLRQRRDPIPPGLTATALPSHRHAAGTPNPDDCRRPSSRHT
jgi:hypothetical protein